MKEIIYNFNFLIDEEFLGAINILKLIKNNTTNYHVSPMTFTQQRKTAGYKYYITKTNYKDPYFEHDIERIIESFQGSRDGLCQIVQHDDYYSILVLHKKINR